MLHWLFSSLAGWLGITGLIIAGCAAVAYLFPPFRRLALEVAGVAFAAAAIYTKGNRDEARKWNEAEQAAIDKGNDARADAERDVAADPDGVRNDKFNRDNG